MCSILQIAHHTLQLIHVTFSAKGLNQALLQKQCQHKLRVPKFLLIWKQKHMFDSEQEADYDPE